MRNQWMSAAAAKTWQVTSASAAVWPALRAAPSSCGRGSAGGAYGARSARSLVVGGCVMSETEPGGDGVALHLGGARVERARHGIPQHALDAVFRGVAISAVHLHRVERRGHERLAHEQLGDRRVERRRARTIQLPGGAVDEQARRLE